MTTTIKERTAEDFAGKGWFSMGKYRTLIKEFLLLTFGTVLVAAGVYFFKFPNNFSTGGVTGIAVILTAVFPNVSSAAFTSGINVVFLILGFIALNKNFGVRTVFCTVLFSLSLSVLERVYPMTAPLTDQKLLELFFAVIFPAIGTAIVFNLQGSTGGTEIIAMILKKYTSLDIGHALIITDVLIAVSTVFFFGIETGLFSILGLLLKSTLVDSVAETINRKKSFTVITENPQIACDFITHRLKRGATYWEAEGAYTHNKRYVVLSALSRSQAVALRRHLKVEDPKAFILVENSSEIFGKGFMQV